MVTVCCVLPGGGSGIGLEITRQLGLHGAKVVIMGRRESVAQEAAASLRSQGVEVSQRIRLIKRPFFGFSSLAGKVTFGGLACTRKLL